MEGRINGRRGRGRPRTMWTDNIKEWTKISYNDCIRVAQDRERWRSMAADLLTTDGTSWNELWTLYTKVPQFVACPYTPCYVLAWGLCVRWTVGLMPVVHWNYHCRLLVKIGMVFCKIPGSHLLYARLAQKTGHINTLLVKSWKTTPESPYCWPWYLAPTAFPSTYHNINNI